MSGRPWVFDASDADEVPSSTSARGLLAARSPISIIIVSGALATPGTSSAQLDPPWDDRYEHTSGPTSAGLTTSPPPEASVELTGPAITELRRLSGLTWDQLGKLFQVSRRSVHFWASGMAMNAANLDRLMRTLEVVRNGDRGDARANRAALFERADGVSPFDLLVARRYDDARSLLGRGCGRRQIGRAPLSEAARAARVPPPPAQLVDAKHDSPPGVAGRGRAARTVRNKRRGSSR